MRKNLLTCLLAPSFLVTALWSHAQESDPTEQVILALEHQWIQAQKTNNPDLLAPLLADRFVNTGTDGTVRNKVEYLANERTTKYLSVDYADLKVIVFGDAAVATLISKGKYTDESGTFESHSRWTDTWVRMPDGKWQCVATHGSNIAK
jgi:hypothetical protein